MTARELAENMGNIDQRLIESAGQAPNYGRRRRTGRLRRTLALAAAAVLMTASFAAGALSGDRGPETISIPGTGVTVVLPESWRGKCGYELQDGSLGVYLRAARTGEGLDDLLKAIGGVLDNGARRVTIHLPYDKGGILETLYQQAKVESVEYGQTIDVKAVCTPRIIGQLGPLVEGWQPHKEPWED